MEAAQPPPPSRFFFFNDTATTEIYTLSLHDALPILSQSNVVVTATPSPAGATASNNTATTGTTGAATFSGLTLSGTAGNYTLSFGGTGLTPVSSGPIALSAGAAASMAPNGGGTSAPAGTAVNPPPSVIVRDSSGNPGRAS